MKEKQIATIETGKVLAEPINISNEDIKNLFCPLATQKEVALALGIVKGLNLNPFLKEVHFIKYSERDRMAIVVGYEVYIKRAERTGKLNGWKAGLKKDEGVAWVEIRRKDWVEPFYWEVSLNEFDKKQSTWKQIPSFMGKKVAIAQGFRLCFPDELGGMPYTSEEQDVYDIETERDMPKSTKPVVAMPEEITEEQDKGTPEVQEEHIYKDSVDDSLPEPKVDIEQIENKTFDQIDTKDKEVELDNQKPAPPDGETSKKNLRLIRDTMAKCKTIDELATLWQQEMKDHESKFTEEDFKKATKCKDYFKTIFQNRAKNAKSN